MQPLETKYGTLVPQHTTDELRKRDIFPVEYHSNGELKSVPLEMQTTIPTPVGDIPAELISFHENGNVNRVFPLNGKLSGYWSESDELGLSQTLTIRTSAGDITAKFISIGFHDNGELRSLTLCPGETAKVMTPLGPLDMRIGISFTSDGQLESVEPASPSAVKTLAGEITAYDPDAVGVNGDANSLMFDCEGGVRRVTTTLTKLKAVHPDGRTEAFTPEYRESLCGDTEQEVVPMIVKFREDEVTVITNPANSPKQIAKKAHLFFAEPHLPQLSGVLGTLRCSI